MKAYGRFSLVHLMRTSFEIKSVSRYLWQGEQKVMERFAVNTLITFRDCKNTMKADSRVVILPLKTIHNANELIGIIRDNYGLKAS